MTTKPVFDAFVVVNPSAGSGRAGKQWHEVAGALSRRLGRFHHAFTTAPGHARTLAREALAAGHEMIVAVGGDGTASEVVSAFFDGKRNRAPHAVFATLPLGTGCDLARSLSHSPVPKHGMDALCRGFGHRLYRNIDVGHARFTGHDGRESERVFVNVASFGCGAAVARSITARDKRLGARLGFNLAAAKALIRYKDKSVSVSFDDQSPKAFDITNLAVCNAQYFGGGMWVSPQARLDDGALNITIWSRFGLKDFLLKQRMLYDGSHVKETRTAVATVGSLSAQSAQQVFLEMDGEAVGELPVSFQILPGALRVKIHE